MLTAPFFGGCGCTVCSALEYCCSCWGVSERKGQHAAVCAVDKHKMHILLWLAALVHPTSWNPCSFMNSHRPVASTLLQCCTSWAVPIKMLISNTALACKLDFLWNSAVLSALLIGQNSAAVLPCWISMRTYKLGCERDQLHNLSSGWWAKWWFFICLPEEIACPEWVVRYNLPQLQ